ncbi:hypothetical protein L538_3987 [Bordetella hinzii 4161]|nr:hypothetical protein L538_3987 [Bordetella hinzii 4161]
MDRSRAPNSGHPTQGTQLRAPNSGHPTQGTQLRAPNSGHPGSWIVWRPRACPVCRPCRRVRKEISFKNKNLPGLGARAGSGGFRRRRWTSAR